MIFEIDVGLCWDVGEEQELGDVCVATRSSGVERGEATGVKGVGVGAF